VIESLPPYISAQVKRFEAAGIDQGQAEMELILCHVLDCNRMDLYLHGAEKLDDSALSRIEEVVKRRLTRYPLQFILNEAWFYGRRFYVTPDVMAPTPETELLCEQAMGFVRLKQIEKPKILDLGVGSGVISVTLACELDNCEVTAVDISPKAIEVARKNAGDHGVADRFEFIESNLFSELNADDEFDLILSNPPYLTEEEYTTVPPEVKADPLISLVSGVDGLNAVRAILSDAPAHLAAGGRLMFEVGYNQGAKVTAITEDDARYRTIVLVKDLNDYDRVIILSCD